jgi:hypothetical protein
VRIVIVGGVRRSLINFRGPLIRALIERGHKVIACAPSAPDDVRAQLAALGAEYCSVPLARAGLNPVGDLRALFALSGPFWKTVEGGVRFLSADATIATATVNGRCCCSECCAVMDPAS